MRRLASKIVPIVLLLTCGANALCYTLQYTGKSGTGRIRWASQTIYLSFSSSLGSSQPNIKEGSEVADALRRAMLNWSNYSALRFVELSSRLEDISTREGDGVSLVTVAGEKSNSALFRGKERDQPAMTRLFYDQSGVISEADIALNPFMRFSTDGTFGTYDLEAVFTHELGHLLGLDHSTIAGAVMQPRLARNGTFLLPSFTGRKLSDDDVAGCRDLYGSATPGAVITGRITVAGGAPAEGVNVWLESVMDGRVIASTVTLDSGAYSFGSLPEGEFRVFASPISGLVLPEDITSLKGAASSTRSDRAQSGPTFLQKVKLRSGEMVVMNGQVERFGEDLNPRYIGLFGQLSTVAVPISAGNTYRIFLAGEGMNAGALKDGLSISSPHLRLRPDSLVQEPNIEIPVISFEVTVDLTAPPGDYTLKLESEKGIAYLVGAISVRDHIFTARLYEETDTGDERQELFLTPIATFDFECESVLPAVDVVRMPIR